MNKLLYAAILFFSGSLYAQDSAKTEVPLTQATVYLGYGAELVHQAKVRIGNDTRTLVLNGLSPTVDLNSLQISCPESVPILEHQFRIIYPPAADVVKLPRMVAMEDSITALQKEIGRLDNLSAIQQDILTKTGQLIENTVSTSGNKTVTSAEVLKLVEYYNDKIDKCRTAIFQYRQKKDELNTLVQAIRGRMNKLVPPPSVQAKAYGQLVLQVLSNSSQEIPVAVSYYTRNAGWTALYDIRVNSKTNKVKLVYKASLMQTTGIDWKKAKLTLSTGTPAFGVSAPVLSPWYLQLYVPAVYNQMQGAAAMNMLQKNTLQSMEEKVEVEVAGYGTRRKDVTGSVSTIDPSTLQQYTTVNPGQLNNNYEISLPYDIASDGQLHNVTIKDQEIACILKNYAVPRVIKESFLLAEVADWQTLDLLPGMANIIMDETYIGKSAIDPNSTSDTLNLSLGKDRRVAVNRSLVKELSGIKASGSQSRQTYTWELTVKNNKLTDVALLLKDQYPLSTIKEVEVKLEDGGDALVNPETGVLTWKLNLKPGESKKVRFSYSIKFPKDKKIVNPK